MRIVLFGDATSASSSSLSIFARQRHIAIEHGNLNAVIFYAAQESLQIRTVKPNFLDNADHDVVPPHQMLGEVAIRFMANITPEVPGGTSALRSDDIKAYHIFTACAEFANLDPSLELDVALLYAISAASFIAQNPAAHGYMISDEKIPCFLASILYSLVIHGEYRVIGDVLFPDTSTDHPRAQLVSLQHWYHGLDEKNRAHFKPVLDALTGIVNGIPAASFELLDYVVDTYRTRQIAVSI